MAGSAVIKRLVSVMLLILYRRLWNQPCPWRWPSHFRRIPQVQVDQYLPDYLLLLDETYDFHFSTTGPSSLEAVKTAGFCFRGVVALFFSCGRLLHHQHYSALKSFDLLIFVKHSSDLVLLMVCKFVFSAKLDTALLRYDTSFCRSVFD